MAKIIIQQSENGVSVKSGSLLNKFYRVGELQATAGSVSGRVTITDTVEGSYVCFEQPYQDIVDNTDTAWGTTQANTVSNLNDVINATPQTYIKSTDKITDLTGVAAGDFLGSKPGYALFSGTTDGSIQTSDAIILGSGEVRLGANLDTNNFNITSNINQNIKLVPGSGGFTRITGDLEVTGDIDLSGGVTRNIMVGGDQYVFQYNGGSGPTNYGLYFNLTNTSFDFNNDSSNPMVSINATNGNTTVAGTFTVGGDIDVKNHSIFTSTANTDVQITPNGTGSVNLDGTIKFKRFDAGATAPAAFEGGMYANDDDELFFGVA